MRALKRAAIVLGLALAGGGFAGVIAWRPAELWAARTATARLSAIFGSDVEVAAVRFRPFSRTVEIRGLTVWNPPGFRRDPAIAAGRVAMRAGWPGLNPFTVAIDELVIDDLEIHLRHEPLRGLNLTALKGNADAATGAVARRAWNWEVREIRGDGARVTLASGLLPAGAVPMRLARFRFTGFGTEHPLEAPELAGLVVRSLLLEILTLKGLLRPVADVIRQGLALR